MKTLTFHLNKFREIEIENVANKITFDISDTKTNIKEDVLAEFTIFTTELLKTFCKNEKEIKFFSSDLTTEIFCRLSKENQIAEIKNLLNNLSIEVEDLTEK